ncbi:Hypothetical protein PHPALM_7556 [Phytophthora palmivora]|uniref:Uncharacterized protein n=1 Tax=Phytophthora palmivora TaxID=4796 RepID=A0A2P4YC10_9STRA|nr:Hypothetical protein PHPALM_7556 [Phytophthora palmivora]
MCLLPLCHVMSLVPSLIATYSASIVLCVSRPCLREPYDMTLPFIIVIYQLTDCLSILS